MHLFVRDGQKFPIGHFVDILTYSVSSYEIQRHSAVVSECMQTIKVILQLDL